MSHLIILLIQILFIALYFICKLLNWPGTAVFGLISWFIPISFYFILSIISSIKKDVKKGLVYFVFSILVFCIPNKIWFYYHNIIFQVIMLIVFIQIIIRNKSMFHKNFIYISYFIFIINALIIPLNDSFIQKYFYSSLNYFSYSNETITWDNFTKTDSLKDGFAACIESDIFYRINKVYNYTPATVIAQMDKKESKYILQTDNLLQHEYYHFKITEIVTNRLSKKLSKNHFINTEKAQLFIDYYYDTLRLMQKQYDFETNHNRNSEKQKEWEAKIDLELDSEI